MRIVAGTVGLGVAAALGLAGCQTLPSTDRTGPPASLPANGGLPGAAQLSPDETTQAAKLYVGKCGRCHKFYEPSGYSEAQWRWWMAKMSKKSRLTTEQERLLSRYLDALRAAGSPQP